MGLKLSLVTVMVNFIWLDWANECPDSWQNISSGYMDQWGYFQKKLAFELVNWVKITLTMQVEGQDRTQRWKKGGLALCLSWAHIHSCPLTLVLLVPGPSDSDQDYVTGVHRLPTPPGPPPSPILQPSHSDLDQIYTTGFPGPPPY